MPSLQDNISDKRPSLAILVTIMMLGPLAMNLLIPSMPGLQAVFGVPYSTVQLTLTFYLAALAVAQLAIGPLSDIFGRRPVALIGFIIYLLGSFLSALAPSITVLIIARILQAAGAASGMVLARAIIRDIYSRQEAASKLALVTMAMVVAPMISPLIGGYLDEAFDWRATFIFAFLFGLLVFLASLRYLYETKPAVHENGRTFLGQMSKLGQAFSALLSQPAFVTYTFAIGLTTAVFFSFLAAAPYLMSTVLKQPPSVYGYYFLLTAMVYSLSNFASSRLLLRFQPRNLILFGALGGVGTIGFGVWLVQYTDLTPLVLFLPVSLSSFFHAMVLPGATAAAVSVRPDIAGAAAGILGSLQLALNALATLIVGYLDNQTALPFMLFSLGLSLAACLAVLIARRYEDDIAA